MNLSRRFAAIFLVMGVVVSVGLAYAGVGRVQLPKLPDPDKYGNVIMDRTSSKGGFSPVIFSHWSHRTLYTCRVCHTELGFLMRKGGSEITMKDIRNGLFCGACHNDVIAFSAMKDDIDCGICHGLTALPSAIKFSKLRARVPVANFGNRIDWVKALDTGAIRPKSSMEGQFQPFEFDKTLTMTPDNRTVPPVTFPHKTHTQWLGCESCHPDIFNIELKGTKRFSMRESLQGRFCGVCHLEVAFPMDDCVRCHINVWPE